MIDIHAHILPGIDDGAQDLYDTLEMASLAVESGVEAMIATPHCNIPGVFSNYFGEKYLEAFRTAKRAIEQEGIPLKLYPGMEVFGTYDLPELIGDGKIMPLNQSHYILVEFSFDEDPGYVMNLLGRVKETGAIPVIAHAERYEFVQDMPQIVKEWKKMGFPVQVNKGSFMGRFGRAPWETAWELVDHHLVSVVASDAHGPYRRTPYMLDAYEELGNGFSREYRQLLFSKNPLAICSDQPLTDPEAMTLGRNQENEQY